jgi:hypothetical protein
MSPVLGTLDAMNQLRILAVCAVLTALPSHPTLANPGSKGNCGSCHPLPNTTLLNDGFGRSLDPEKLERATPLELKNDLLEFAKRRLLIIKFVNRDIICRALARYISAPMPETGTCPDSLSSKEGDVRATIDSFSL